MMTSTKWFKVTLRIRTDTIAVMQLNMLISPTLELKPKRASINVISVAARLQSSFRPKEIPTPSKKCRRRRGSGERQVTPHRCTSRETTWRLSSRLLLATSSSRARSQNTKSKTTAIRWTWASIWMPLLISMTSANSRHNFPLICNIKVWASKTSKEYPSWSMEAANNMYFCSSTEKMAKEITSKWSSSLSMTVLEELAHWSLRKDWRLNYLQVRKIRLKEIKLGVMVAKVVAAVGYRVRKIKLPLS